jgi:hypothetical protein
MAVIPDRICLVTIMPVDDERVGPLRPSALDAGRKWGLMHRARHVCCAPVLCRLCFLAPSGLPIPAHTNGGY